MSLASASASRTRALFTTTLAASSSSFSYSSLSMPLFSKNSSISMPESFLILCAWSALIACFCLSIRVSGSSTSERLQSFSTAESLRLSWLCCSAAALSCDITSSLNSSVVLCFDFVISTTVSSVSSGVTFFMMPSISIS